MLDGNEWRTVTVDKLCIATGLNKRYFHENFDGLDSVAAAVLGATVDAILGFVNGRVRVSVDDLIQSLATL